MKRTLTYILTLVLALSMLLVGCSTPPSDNDQESGGSATPPTTSAYIPTSSVTRCLPS